MRTGIPLLQFPPSLLLPLLLLYLPSFSSGCSNDPSVQCSGLAWACASHSSWMAIWCPETCNTCKPCSCQDDPAYRSRCPGWKGHCLQNTWVREHCPSTCNTCQCCDERTDLAGDLCVNYAAHGYCLQYPDYMWPNCHKTCSSQECSSATCTCQDHPLYSSRCSGWRDHCGDNKGVRDRCPATCNACQCCDVRTDLAGDICVNYAANGYCSSSNDQWMDWMWMYCYKSCSSQECSPDQGTSCKCGLAKRSSRITGGQEVEVNEYPWQVGLVRRGEQNTFCGGSVIGDEWILTAGHCVDEPAGINGINDFQVILGEHDYLDADLPVKMDISTIIFHPSYVHDGFYGEDGKWNTIRIAWDFALLKMRSKVNWAQNPNIRPICLPEASAGNYNQRMSKATGWGATQVLVPSPWISSNELLETDVRVVANSYCSNFWSGTNIEASMLCAMDYHGVNGICRGDSGGPLVTCRNWGTCGTSPGQNYELIGVSSFGASEGCGGRTPDVFARVTVARAWIDATVGGLNTCPRV